MIISRTPFRISFFGGGTDYPDWSRVHGGSVLATTINKYCYITCRYLPPFFGHRSRIVWSQIERCLSNEEINHPVVRAALKYLSIESGVEIHHDGDLPARSGMGSSSAFTVGLLQALYALKGRLVTKDQLAKESIYLEQNVLCETVGSQDQILAAYGGFNHITFLSDGGFAVRPMTLSPDRIQQLNQHLMLFYTGIERTAADVAESFIHQLNDKSRQLRVFKEMVAEAIDILCHGKDLSQFGLLLDEAWQLKRSLSSRITNETIDDIYTAALSAGAIGGKITGAGGGGFLLLFVPQERQASVKEKLAGLIHVPFCFEARGSEIIFFEAEAEYSDSALNERLYKQEFQSRFTQAGQSSSG